MIPRFLLRTLLFSAHGLRALIFYLQKFSTKVNDFSPARKQDICQGSNHLINYNNLQQIKRKAERRDKAGT